MRDGRQMDEDIADFLRRAVPGTTREQAMVELGYAVTPSDPAACPNCTSLQRGVRYSDDPGALCGHSWHDEPSDPAAVPPPEWAQKAVASVIVRRLVDGELPDDGTDGLYALARLLASVREGALREAASVPSGTEIDASRDAILALLDTPPSGGV